MEYRHTVLLDDVTAADGQRDDELPINPISHIIYTLRWLNSGTDTKATLSQILGALENVSIVQGGRTMISLSGDDLFRLNTLFMGFEPIQENVTRLDNAARHLSLIIPMGRKLYDPNECFPATSRGELFLSHTLDIADTGYDGLTLQIEVVELPEARPQNHLTYTTISHTPSASGDSDISLPIGLKYLGMLLFSTTIPTATSFTTTVNQVTLLADNFEKYIRASNWESLHGLSAVRSGAVNQWAEKINSIDVTGGVTLVTDDNLSGLVGGVSKPGSGDITVDIANRQEQDDSDVAQYAYIDFDPNKDDVFTFDTNGLSSLTLRIDAGDTNAVRVIPIQLKSAA